MIQRIYLQCPRGHYSSVSSGGCWFDHWAQAPIPDEFHGDIGVGSHGSTIEDVVRAGFPQTLVPHAVLLDFGATASAFDGMIPMGFVRTPTLAHTGIDDLTPSFPLDVASVNASPVLYFRCNDGHYFTGTPTCPLDGWCVAGMTSARSAFSKAVAGGCTPRPNTIVPSGDDELMARMIVAQYGDPKRAVYGIVPMIYYHNGMTFREIDAPRELL